MAKKSLRLFKNIRLFIFDYIVDRILYQYAKNQFAMISTKILKQNSDFRFWKKKLKQNQNIHNFCVSKKSNNKKSIVQNWKKSEKKTHDWQIMTKKWKFIEHRYNRSSFVQYINQTKKRWNFRNFFEKCELQNKKKIVTNSKKMILANHHDFLNVFFKQKIDKFLFRLTVG